MLWSGPSEPPSLYDGRYQRMAQVTTVSTEGQIVLPQELRSALDIQPGDTLQVERVGKPR